MTWVSATQVLMPQSQNSQNYETNTQVKNATIFFHYSMKAICSFEKWLHIKCWCPQGQIILPSSSL